MGTTRTVLPDGKPAGQSVVKDHGPGRANQRTLSGIVVNMSSRDHVPIDRCGAELEPGEAGVALLRTADGRALFVPSSVSKLRGVQAELVVDIQDQAARVHEAQADLDRLIAEARDEGVSWVAVGFSVGMTAQGARQRWGG